jgi:hypothetical protein
MRPGTLATSATGGISSGSVGADVAAAIGGCGDGPGLGGCPPDGDEDVAALVGEDAGGGTTGTANTGAATSV